MKKFWQTIGKNEIRNTIAVISVIGAFVMLYIMIIKPIPAENKDTVNMTVGFVLGGLVGGINGYYFGASKTDTDRQKEVEHEK